MKRIIVMIGVLIALNGFSQKTFKDLIGRWEIIGEQDSGACLEVVDSSTMILIYNGETRKIKEYKIDFIVLAGFLWKVPDLLIQAYPGKIVNIHPALLPKYGGKGMYGQHVHEAVIAAGEKESGITIHFVDGHYDNGDIIFQATCPVLEHDNSSTLANRIHQLEHRHYPKVVEDVIVQQVPH